MVLKLANQKTGRFHARCHPGVYIVLKIAPGVQFFGRVAFLNKINLFHPGV